MKNKLISIIVPVYNCECYLHSCVDSILAQTYKDLEIILVNDGSEDCSGQICDEYALKDKRIKVIHKQNGGQQEARNEGIAVAQGELIGFVDSDDWIEPQMYEKLFNAMNDADLITSGIIKHDQDGNIKEIWTDPLPEDVYTGKEKMEFVFDNLFLFRDYNRGRVIGGICNNMVCKLFRSSIAKKIYQTANIYLKYEEDAVFCFLYTLQCKKIIITHESYYHYRYNADSISNKASSGFWERRNQYYVAIDKALNGHWMENNLRIQFGKRFLYGTLAYLYGERDIPLYTYPDENITNGKIVLFGAGVVGRSFYKEMNANKRLKVVLWIDNNPPGELVMGRKIEMPMRIQAEEYDYVICAVSDEETAKKMEKQLIELGVAKDKICWKKPIIPFKEILLR